MTDGWYYINISGLGIGPMYLMSATAPMIIGGIVNLARRVEPRASATILVWSNGAWAPLPGTF
jgi:hypothetical protein